MMKTTTEAEREYILLTEWCQINSIGIRTAYRMIADKELKVTHIRKRPYLSIKNRTDFAKFLAKSAA